MSNLVIIRGVPASGKSTVALTYRDQGYTLVNRDDIRYALYRSYWGGDIDEDVVTDVENAAISSALRKGDDVVVDATNLNHKALRTKLSLASEFNAEVTYHDVVVSFDTAVAQDEARAAKQGRSVGKAVIKGFFKRYHIDETNGLLPPALPAWPVFEKALPHEKGKLDAYIVDTDGTVADSDSVRNPYDVSKYHLDKPITHVIGAVEGVYDAGFCIVGVSGRKEKYRDITLDWWGTHLPSIEHSGFFMRPDNDNRVDAIVKYEIFKRDIEPHYNIFGAFDDRPQVLRMWRAVGIPTFDVGKSVEF